MFKMAAYRTCTQILQRLNVLTRKLDACGDSFNRNRLHTSLRVCAKKDPVALFMSDPVQTLLHRITGQDPDRVFSIFKADKAEPPQYKVLTDEELQEERDLALGKASERLQMPPFMNCREQRDEVLSDDPDIAPTLTSKYMFVDISENTRRIQVENQRPVVCRHTDGQLRWADWDVVDRLSQVYAPVPGRQIYMPKLFDDQYVEMYLKAEQCNYIYLLEQACVQFEPDNEHFIRVTHRVYEHICEKKRFDELRSTRFFGPMSFYFCWVNKVEPLLIDMVHREMISDAADLITLYNIVRDKPVSAQADDHLQVVKKFCEASASSSYSEELVQALEEYETSRQSQQTHRTS